MHSYNNQAACVLFLWRNLRHAPFSWTLAYVYSILWAWVTSNDVFTHCHVIKVAKTKQRIEEEKMQVQVVERTQQITLQEQEITRREKELEAKVRKPADAERYRIEKIAEAERWGTDAVIHKHWDPEGFKTDSLVS